MQSLAYGDDAEGLLQQVCATKNRPTITQSELKFLKEKKRFPTGNDSITERQSYCQMRKNQLALMRSFGDKQYSTVQIQNETFVIDIAADLNAKIKEKTDQELKYSEVQLKKYEECAKSIQSNKSLSSVCTDFKNRIIPMLNTRLKLLRQFLAMTLLQDNQLKKNPALRHPFFIGKKEDVFLAKDYEVSALTEAEFNRIKSEIENDPEALENSKKIYLKLLSQSPMLLYFKGSEVTPSELISAFQRSKDNFREIKEQEYIHIDGNLIEVLKSIPDVKRANYCVVAKELRKNIEHQATFYKFVLDLASISAQSFLASIGALIATVPLDNAIDSNLNAQKLNFKFSLCMRSTLIEDSQDQKTHLCDFESIQKNADAVKSSSIYVPLFGTPESLKKNRPSKSGF